MSLMKDVRSRGVNGIQLRGKIVQINPMLEETGRKEIKVIQLGRKTYSLREIFLRSVFCVGHKKGFNGMF